MTIFSVYTLIDITATGEISNDLGLESLRNQQRNWETAHQVVSLGKEVNIIAVPTAPQLVDLSRHNFGSYYRGHHRCWKFIFQVDCNSNSALEKLESDFDNVPIIAGLEETIALPYAIFSSKGILKNTYIRIST